MTSTCNWLRRHRLAALTATAALTTLMLTPELADAGHRRHHRARHCCCGHAGYGYAGHGYGHGGYYGHRGYRGHYGTRYSYGQGGYAYGNSGWSNRGYADSGIRYDDSRVQGRIDSNVPYSDNVIGQSDQSRPQALPEGERMQGERTMSARPDLDQGVPPAPQGDSASDANRDQRMQDGAQQTEQLRQRVQTLEQENARLKQQLEEARGSDKNAPAEPRNQSPQDNQTGAEAEATSDTESAPAELPAPPEADADAEVEADAEVNADADTRE